MKVFNINDTYFKYQKCLSGITYQFVNQLDNIYDKNLMVGTNYCIYCMYNEFDIINNFMINLYQVDVCSTINLDLTQRYYQIDNAYLRTGHRVLLVKQNDPTQNDIYNVDSRGYLILSDELADTGRTWRYKAYVKLGDNKGKQFHLRNSGNRFPLKGERKSFLDGHGYIVKSIFNYDLFDTGPIIQKLAFCDYELARISVNRNYDLYSGFSLPTTITGSTIDIQYHGGSYLINVDDDTTKYTYTGITSGSTIYNYNDTTYGYGNETYIYAGTNFCTNANVYDYIKLEVSGATNLYLKTFIKSIYSPYIMISDYIPDHILYEYYTGTTISSYTLTNLMYSEQSDVTNTMLESFYSKYFDIDSSNYLYPIENVDNKYFDYDGLTFVFSGDTTVTNIFTTGNRYIKYRLFEHLNQVNSYLFDTNYSFLINYTLPGTLIEPFEYYDDRNNPIVYPSTLGDSKGTLIKITPFIPSLVNYFKNYTYVNLTNSTGKYKTLIVDLVPNEYFVIETYKSNSGLTINNIETIYNLKEISDILYDVYINDETPTNTDYYRVRDDDMKRNICNGYADFISQDIGIIDNLTAFLLQDSEHKFILKIYDPENSANGGVVRKPVVITKIDETHTSTSAVLPGEITSDGGSNITGRGICYSDTPVSQNICVSASTYMTGIGPFVSNITGLLPERNYYYKAYASNIQGTSFGNVYSFNTSTAVYTGATVTMDSVTPYSHHMLANASVVDRGWTPILTRGIVYQIGTVGPIISDNIVVYTPESGLVGSYQVDLTGLSHSTVYSYNAFAINVCGTTYGNSGTTSTLFPSPPVIDTVRYDPTTLSYDIIDVLCDLISNDGPLDDPIHGVDQMGVVWSTDPVNLPTTGDTVQPTTLIYPYNLGPFTINLTGLSYSTTYFFRAYAQNTLYIGDTTAYGPLKQAITLPLPLTPTLQINVLNYSTYSSNVSNTILSNGNSPIVSKGVYISTTNPPTISDPYWVATGTTDWVTNLTGLTPNTTYYLMNKSTNLYGLTGYSSVSGFTTLPIQSKPSVTLSFISSGSSTAILGGVITSDGNATITSKGVCYSTSPIPSSPIWYEGNGSSSWTSTITGLTNLTTYYVRSFATNSIGTTYSSPDIQFATASGYSKPSFSVNSPTVSNIGTVNVDVTDNIVSDGGTLVTSRGIQYSGTTIPALLDWYGGIGSGSWSTTITGLTLGGNYYVFAYATNSEGTTYTPSVIFSTLSVVPPTIIINNITDITITGATINSTVTSGGYATVISMGTTGGTIGNWIYSTPGVTSFSINLTGLTQNTTYDNIQSYATNSSGTGWSNVTGFTTLMNNNAMVKMSVTSSSSVDPIVYQVGTITSDIVTSVGIIMGNVPINQLWSGNTTFTASSTTGLTWGLGISNANNIASPYTYSPLVEETQNFVAIESCGTPSQIKSNTITVYAVYPLLTCNRIPLLPIGKNLYTLCTSGAFYTGNFLPGNEPMLKKVEVFSSSKIYSYNIGATNNLVYFAYPASYGVLTSIVANGVVVGSPAFFPNQPMTAVGMWSGIPYHVYIFAVTANLGPIYIVYNY